MPLHFLADDGPALTDTRPGETVVLRGPEAHHAAAVRRVRVGEEVTVGDGAGAWLSGTVASVQPKEVVISVLAVDVRERTNPQLTLVQALAKGDRDELAIQAATELGVDRIVPWQSARSVSRWDAQRSAKGVARWRTITREAAKQAHRAWLPEVSAPVTTADLCRMPGTVLVLEPRASVPLTTLPLPAGGDLVLVVGPEGGIAPEELTALADAGARPVRLGDTVLRTSTAGPAALAVVNARLERW